MDGRPVTSQGSGPGRRLRRWISAAGDQEEHVPISPDDGADEEAAQGVEYNVLNRDAREVQSMHQVLPGAHQQNGAKPASSRNQMMGSSTGQVCSQARDEPDVTVLPRVQDDQQLRECNVENARTKNAPEYRWAPSEEGRATGITSSTSSMVMKKEGRNQLRVNTGQVSMCPGTAVPDMCDARTARASAR